MLHDALNCVRLNLQCMHCLAHSSNSGSLSKPVRVV